MRSAREERGGSTSAERLPQDGRVRVVVSGFSPEVDGGLWPARRVTGEPVLVEADIFADAHDVVAASLLHRAPGESAWSESALEPLGNDRWRGGFTPQRPGLHEVVLEGWVDRFASWRHDMEKRVAAGQHEPGAPGRRDVEAELLALARLLERRAASATGQAASSLRQAATRLAAHPFEVLEFALGSELAALAARTDPREDAARLGPRLIDVDRPLARDGAWYELFPRSHAAVPGEHGTLRDVEALVPRLASLGFDVLYLPPIHPIGATHRKGRNNSRVHEPGDVGSPWAIGSSEGGHDAVHPRLGTQDDVRRLCRTARGHGMEIALDFALQCSPDHPWLKEHPDWFRWRPDGTIRHAENPPKKYEDIVPLDFECEDWRGLWEACLGIVLHWMDHGVRAFRVDNPHGKPFRFWQWLIRSARAKDPDVFFLSEAFTRPRVMEHLAKAGFAQSYTYFTWRTGKRELEEYLSELHARPLRDYFRPAFWPNTPDILHESLQRGGPQAFAMRLVLAATAASTYGVYGPPYEACDGVPVRDGSEEYLDSEKYQIRSWTLDDDAPIASLMRRLNAIRKLEPAFRGSAEFSLRPCTDDALLCFTRCVEGAAPILVTINLDPLAERAGWVHVDAPALGLPADAPFGVTDLLDGSVYEWRHGGNYVALDPRRLPAPAHVFRIHPLSADGQASRSP